MNGRGCADEVIDVHLVAQVGVGIVLEVLQVIQVLENPGVSADTLEGESLVVKFPSVNLRELSSEFTSNNYCIIVVLNVEVA